MARPILFDMSEEELNSRINEYKQDVKDGVFKANWEHFLGYIGLSVQDAVSIRESTEKVEQSIYTGQVRALKKLATWINGQYAVAPGWSGPNGSKAIFLQKQSCNGYFIPLSDRQEIGHDGKIEVNVRFGAGKDGNGAFD